MFVTVELEVASQNAASIISVAGVGETAEASQKDAMAYLTRIAKKGAFPCIREEEEMDWDYWQDCAGDSGFSLVTLQLASIPPEWEVKPCDKE